jgi:hypothetical protein
MINVRFLKQVAGQKVGWTKELDSSLVDQLLAKGWVEVVGEIKAPSKPKATPKKVAPKKAKGRKKITIPKAKK